MMKNLSDNLIGILTDPCPDLLTGLFGIIKSGNGFVPIDPTQPNERIGFIIDDCQIAILLTQDKHLAKAIEIYEKSACLQKIVCLDKITQPKPNFVAIYDYENDVIEETPNETFELKPEQPVYVIYTSGTTGVPKGVPISHRCWNGVENISSSTNKPRCYKILTTLLTLAFLNCSPLYCSKARCILETKKRSWMLQALSIM